MIRIIIIIVVLITAVLGGGFGIVTFAPGVLPNPILNFLGVALPAEEKVADPKVRPSATETVLIDIDPVSYTHLRAHET